MTAYNPNFNLFLALNKLPTDCVTTRTLKSHPIGALHVKRNVLGVKELQPQTVLINFFSENFLSLVFTARARKSVAVIWVHPDLFLLVSPLPP